MFCKGGPLQHTDTGEKGSHLVLPTTGPKGVTFVTRLLVEKTETLKLMTNTGSLVGVFP